MRATLSTTDTKRRQSTTAAALSRAESGHALILTTLRPSDQHLAAVHLAKLALGSQRARRQTLDVVVGILTSGRCDAKALLDRQRAAV
jgi:hypothetical protein